MATLGQLLGKTEQKSLLDTGAPAPDFTAYKAKPNIKAQTPAMLGGLLKTFTSDLPHAVDVASGIPGRIATAGPQFQPNPAVPNTFSGQVQQAVGQTIGQGIKTNKPLPNIGQAAGPVAGLAALFAEPTGFEGTAGKAAKTLKDITASEDATKILEHLRSLFKEAPEQTLTKAARDLAVIKNPTEVGTYLDNLAKEVTQTSMLEQGGTQTLRQGGQEIQQLPQEGSSALEPLNRLSPEAIQTGSRVELKESLASSRSLQRAKDLVNLERISVGEEATAKLMRTLESIRPELEKIKGGPLSNAEVLKAAQDSAILQKATSREATLKSEAALLATRQNLAALAEGQGVSKDFIDQLRIVSQEATRRGRELQALGIGADPLAKTTKGAIVAHLLDLGVNADEMIKAAEHVDFNNLREATNFYRHFVKPTWKEWIDEYRYINLLSSPKTHIVNAFSNLIQGTILNPATRLASGAIDFVMSGLTGKERSIYMKEVAPYTKGFLNAVPNASKSFLEALKGNIFMERPDVKRIPTGSKVLRPFQVIPRMLEASDVFFRTLITEGEKQAIATRYLSQGKQLDEKALADIEAEAKKQAEYYVFRSSLDPANKEGQGKLLSAIDKATTAVYQLRSVPGVKWFIPFVQTPMNILKQGIEYSPLGLGTLPGSTNKTVQLGKSMVGSVVFLGAASLAMQGKTTWSAPSSAKEKDAFYNSGRQPYSIKIGDSWVSFSKLGPLAYPIAMAAAVQWYAHENPKAVAESGFEKTADVLTGIAQFFSDQSYMQGMQNLIDFASGQTRLTGVQSTVSSLTGQLVPLSSLQRWVTQIIDPVYRKPDTKFNAKDLVQSLSKDIPGLSQGVPRIEGSLERQNPYLNALSPLQITNVNPRYETKLRQVRSQQRTDARLKAIRNK